MLTSLKTGDLSIRIIIKYLPWLIALSGICFVNLSYSKTDSPAWKLSQQSASLSVHYRKVETSELIEIKARAKINSTLSGFLHFIQDTNNIPKWLDNASNSQILEKIDKQTIIFKTQFKGFWPIKARDLITHSHYWQNEDLSVEIKIRNAATETIHNSNNIVINIISAHWLITPISKNTIQIEYIFIADAKGAIPKWIVNRMTLKSTWKTLANLQQQLPQSIWQKHELTHIRDKR